MSAPAPVHVYQTYIRAGADGMLADLRQWYAQVGLPATLRPGVGLRSMRERAEELGGTLTIEPGPEGGTRVAAILPIEGA